MIKFGIVLYLMLMGEDQLIIIPPLRFANDLKSKPNLLPGDRPSDKLI
jgi:hypothetical protein